MTNELQCNNCTHSKEDHHLVLDRSGGGDFLPGTSMPSGKLNQILFALNAHATTISQKRIQNQHDNL